MMRGEPTCAAVIPLPAPHTAHLGTKDTRANFLTLNTLCNHLMGKFPPRFYKQTTGNNEVMRNVKKRRRHVLYIQIHNPEDLGAAGSCLSSHIKCLTHRNTQSSGFLRGTGELGQPEEPPLQLVFLCLLHLFV